MTVTDLVRNYDTRALLPFDGTTNAAEVAAAIDLLTQHAPNRSALICDVGCGAGWHLREMSRRGYQHLCGIDLSGEALMCAQAHGIDAFWVEGDVAAWGVRNAFDVVTSFNSCLGSNGRTHDAAMMRAVRHILKPHGLYLLTYIDLAIADRWAGQFRSRYDVASPLELVSDVWFDRIRGRLNISQRIKLDTETRTVEEAIDVYDAESLRQLLAESGLNVLPDMEAPDIHAIGGALQFVRSVLATCGDDGRS